MRLENLRIIFLTTLSMAMACAQGPTIGSIEIFGAPPAVADKIRQTLAIKPGDPIPKSKVDLEDQIVTSAGIARSAVDSFYARSS